VFDGDGAYGGVSGAYGGVPCGVFDGDSGVGDIIGVSSYNGVL